MDRHLVGGPGRHRGDQDGRRAARPWPAARAGWTGLARSFGPLAVVLIPTLLILWIMTTATVFRAVISPGEHGWHLFKLGPDEARLGLVTAAGFALVVLFGGAPALLLFVLVKPILTAAPGSGRWIVDLGAAATVCLELWIAVRLSLASVHTFAEGRFHVVGYWRLTRGHFWRLLGSYVLVFLLIVGFVVALALAALVSGWFAEALGVPHGLDLPRRGGLLFLALVVAVMSGGLLRRAVPHRLRLPGPRLPDDHLPAVG